MKNMKKIVKSILCGLMALGCLLSSTLSAYAADIGCSVSYVSSFDDDGTPKSYVGYDPSNAFSFYAITFLGNYDGYHFLVGQLTDNLNDLTSLKTTTHFVDPKKDDVVLEKQYSAKAVTVLDFLKKTYNSQGTTGATLYDLSVTKILENPNYSNYTKEFIEKALSSYYFACNFKNYGLNIGDSKYEFSAQKKWSIMDFVFYLLNCYEKGIKPGEDQQDSDHLPMLTYSLKRTTVVGFPSITQIKENLSWDYTEKELYKDNPTKYNVEVWVSANWKAAPTGIGNIRDVSNMQFNDKAKLAIDSAIPIVKNSYGWLYSDKGKKLYKEAGQNWGDESGYNLFIRTYEVGGSKVSYWKVYNLALGGYVQQEDTLIDENGNKVPISKEDYDIGNTEHDGKNKDDQSSDAPFSTDNKDDADESPTSDFNKSNGNYSIDSFLGSIKNVINTISGIPSLLSSLASWLDPRLIALITASIALVISIGLVKMIL